MQQIEIETNKCLYEHHKNFGKELGPCPDCGGWLLCGPFNCMVCVKCRPYMVELCRVCGQKQIYCCC